MNDVSNASGVNNKSHRSTNAVVRQGGGTFTGETEAPGSPLEAITPQQARDVLTRCQSQTANGLPHIAYASPMRHNNGANYTFADGHSRWMTLDTTLNPNNYQWGKRFYSHNSMIYRPGSTIPVQ
jgi:prepilin-type processing-associated H-X9-DG protein